MGVFIADYYKVFNLGKQLSENREFKYEFQSFAFIFQRVHGANIKRHLYADVEICDRWKDPQNGFKNFIADVGRRPKGMTLEKGPNRIYGVGSYWCTPKDQSLTIKKDRVGLYVFLSKDGSQYGIRVGLNGNVFRKTLSSKKYTKEQALRIADAIAIQFAQETTRLNFPLEFETSKEMKIPGKVSFESKGYKLEYQRRHDRKLRDAMVHK